MTTNWSGTYDSNKVGHKLKGTSSGGNTPRWKKVVIGEDQTIEIFEDDNGQDKSVWGPHALVDHRTNPDQKRAVNGNPSAPVAQVCNCLFFKQGQDKRLEIVFTHFEKDGSGHYGDPEGDEIGVWRSQYSGPPPDGGDPA